MASRLTALLLGFLLAACASVHLTPSAPVRSPVQFALDHSQLLYPPGCTGVKVAERVVVTAKHCVADDAKVMTSMDVGGPDPAMIRYISDKYDFVVLTFPFDGTKYVGTGHEFISMRSAVPGEHLYLVGYPQQVRTGKQKRTITDGIFTGVVEANGDERVSAPAYFGNSGGGVWGDDGALLGLLVNGDFAEAGRWPMPYPAAAYMVPIDQVVKALDDLY